MNIAIRFFVGYFLIVGLAAWFVLNIFTREVEPGVRQATEDTLVDSANLFAELAAPELATGTIASGRFAAAVEAARQRSPQARIYGVDKASVDFRVYLTDARGIVVFDSEGRALGADYSQWRDVALALRGAYGARSTRDDESDPDTSVMYVAAPVVRDGERIGVLSLAKPTRTVQPYADQARDRVLRAGLLLLGVSAAIGLLFTFWLTWSLNRLRDYARSVAEGGNAPLPSGGGRQLSELARALALMRERLEGKQYVERYVQSLAHEMKSPLTAIVGAAEILEGDPPADDRRRFAANIAEQSQRLQATIERMLMLARLEQLQSPEAMRMLQPATLVAECLALRGQVMAARQLHPHLQVIDDRPVRGDAFLLQQAILNLLDNAIAFSPDACRIDVEVAASGELVSISVRDHGAGAPHYALPQLFNRFYSLPCLATGKKSTGLGLALVREIARLHGGDASFANHPQGGGVGCIRIRAG